MNRDIVESASEEVVLTLPATASARVGGSAPPTGVRGAAATTSGAGARAAGGLPSRIDQLEWMDSLYVDVIHSTTDLRSGLHKARDLERPAGVVESFEEGGWEEECHSTGVDDDDTGSINVGSVDLEFEVEDDREGESGGSDGRWKGEDDKDRDRQLEEEKDEANNVVTHKDIICFPYGAVVFWGCSEVEVYPVSRVSFEVPEMYYTCSFYPMTAFLS